jgi:hypothetical protein
MDICYDIIHINGLRLIKFHKANTPIDGTPLILSLNQSNSVLETKTRHEENALYYQFARLVYIKAKEENVWLDDRKKCRKNNRDAINKFYKLLQDKLIYINFKSAFNISNPLKNESYDRIASKIFKDGFMITKRDGTKVKFLPFQKSGSMSRAYTISFIDENYKDELDKRLNFDLFLDNEKYNISKVLAYKGLYLSNGIRIELDNLDENSVVVVKDYEKVDNTSFYTTVINRTMIKNLVIEMLLSGEKNVLSENLLVLKNYCIGINSAKAQEYYDHIDLKQLNTYAYLDYKRNEMNGIQINYFEDIIKIFQSCKEYHINSSNDLFEFLKENRPMMHSAIEQLINDHYEILEITKLKDDEYKLIDNVNAKVETNMFDGQGIIDKSFMQQINKDFLNIKQNRYHYSTQFRLPFSKGMLHAVDMPEWFAFCKKNYIIDAFGIKRDANKIKIIITKSQFKCFNWLNTLYNSNQYDKDKYNDPMKYYFYYFKKYNHSLYFTNLDNPSSSTNGKTVLNYQVLHTPALLKKDFYRLLEIGNNHYKNLLTDTQKQVEYYTMDIHFEDSVSNIDYKKLKKEHILMGEILKRNPDYINDSLFQSRIKKVADSILKNTRLGRIQIEGSVNYLVGDLLDNLHYITFGLATSTSPEDIGDFFYLPNSHETLVQNKAYSILRNPHITSKELISSKPIPNDKNRTRSRFFGHLNNIIMINAYTNKMMAMQTADTDGDMVRLIYNDIYNQAVQKAIEYNEGNIILYPDIKGEDKLLNNENIYQTIKQTFSARVGLISNHAFSHSIIAYNENFFSDPNAKKKERLEAEKLSCIVAAEIDAAKSGKAPYYESKIISEPYIKYNKSIRTGINKKINFNLNPESPNLHYLKENTDITEKEVKKIKLSKDSTKIIRYNFEDKPDWKKSLKADLKKDLSLLMVAYSDWNKHIGYLWKENQTKISTTIHTIAYILELQCDDGANEMLIENLINKFISLDKKILDDARNNLIKEKWHFALNTEKDSICENVLTGILSQDEKECLFNFNHDGHKLFFLTLTEAISRIDKEKFNEISTYDSVSRYKTLMKHEMDQHNLESDDIIKNLIGDILESNQSSKSVMKKYIDKTTLKNTYEYSEVEKHIESLSKKLNTYKKKNKEINLEDLDAISRHFSKISSSLFDEGKNLVESTISREFAYDYCQNEIDRMFIKHDENLDELIKYVYSLKKFDPSSKFLFSICYEKLLDNIKDTRNEGENSVK